MSDSPNPQPHEPRITDAEIAEKLATCERIKEMLGDDTVSIIERALRDLQAERQRNADLEDVIRHCSIGQAPDAIRRVFDAINYDAGGET